MASDVRHAGVCEWCMAGKVVWGLEVCGSAFLKVGVGVACVSF